MMVAGLLALGTAPRVAIAQVSAGQPVVELGVEYSAGPHGDGEWSSIGGRVLIRIDDRTALEGVFSPERDRDNFSHVDYLTVQLRRDVHLFDGGAVFGTLGGAFSSNEYKQYAYPSLEPIGTFTEREFGPSFGFGAEVRAARYLAVRGEAQYVLSQDSVLRLGGGISVPIGAPYPPRAVTIDPPSLARTPLARVRSNRIVWVTVQDGREYKGQVVSRSPDALTLRHPGGATTIATSDISVIETPDSLVNGVWIGAVAGGAVGAAVGGGIGDFACEGSGGCVFFGAVLVGGIGGGIGALAGAVVDSIRDGRQTLFERRVGPRASVTLAPVIGRNRGIAGVVRW
jgi:hypothetical protein